MKKSDFSKKNKTFLDWHDKIGTEQKSSKIVKLFPIDTKKSFF